MLSIIYSKNSNGIPIITLEEENNYCGYHRGIAGGARGCHCQIPGGAKYKGLQGAPLGTGPGTTSDPPLLDILCTSMKVHVRYVQNLF